MALDESERPVVRQRPVARQRANESEAVERSSRLTPAHDERSTEPRLRRRPQSRPGDEPLSDVARPYARRELDTNGIPIRRPQNGVVAQAHRQAQERQQRHQDRLSLPTPIDEPVASPPARRVATPLAGRPASVPPVSGGRTTGNGPEPPAAGDPPAGERRAAGPLPVVAPRVAPSSALVADWEAEWYELRHNEHGHQACANCRDFRQSEMPGRGWCVNGFAFATRQLVEQEDLACLGPLGSWWVASDRFWLDKIVEPANVATPLTDGMIELMRMPLRSHGRR